MLNNSSRGWAFGIWLRFLVTGLYGLVLLSGPAFADGGIAQEEGDVRTDRVIAQQHTGQDWLINGRDFGSTHFSPLKQVNAEDVNELGLAWSLDLDSPEGLPVEPIEVDGTIYVSGTLDRIFAVDAATGRLRWKYDPHVDLSATTWGSYSARINRGVAVWKGKVYIGTGDCRVIAVDAASGRSLWQTRICDSTQTGITGAPRVGAGKVFIGYFASDTGTRGSLVALDASTGKIAWRFWNTPGDPAKGYKSAAMAMAAKTWHGKDWWKAGGGAVWDPIVYDPTTGLVIYGTAGPAAGFRYGVETSGDRLFCDSIVALKADTGQYVWHYQTAKLAPPGTHSPENFHIIIADLKIHGVKQHVVMTSPRWAGFIVLDAKSGQLISSKLMARGFGSQLRSGSYGRSGKIVLQREWWPMSYDPATQLVYVPVFEFSGPAAESVQRMSAAFGRLVAWNPLAQSARWSVGQPLAINGGVLSTAGGLVFQGEGTGAFSAYSAENGKRLWSMRTGSAIQGIPITYELNGKQYILVPVGLGGGTRLFAQTSAMATPETKRGPARLLAFAIGAKTPFPYPPDVVPHVPKPPEQTASAAEIQLGKEVLQKYMCWGCHGGPTLDGAGAWVTNGAIPDLRYMPPEIHKLFYAIVLGGLKRKEGMPGFADGHLNWPMGGPMTASEAKHLYAYIVDLQWKAYREDQKRAEAISHH